jgi:catechol 2,3-dioxygenase-like lactoylglutathione lyase family enzyme
MENHATDTILARPRLAYLHHVSLPCRDLAESKRFYIDVLGGELYHDTPGFAEVMLAGMIVGMSEQAEGWTGWEAEYPHYGFNGGQSPGSVGRAYGECQDGGVQHGWGSDCDGQR